MKTLNYIYYIVIALFLIIASSAYVVDEAEQAVVTEFGKPVKTVTEAGLNFKIPFIQTVIKFDKRILEWDGAPNEIPTYDNKYIQIDTYARWKISNPLQFYKAAKNEVNAQSRLDDIIDGVVRDQIANNDLVEIIRTSDRLVGKDPLNVDKEDIAGNRENIINNVYYKVAKKLHPLVSERFRDSNNNGKWDKGEFYTDSNSNGKYDKDMPNKDYLDLGIEILDFQIKRISYAPQVQDKAFKRMISEQLKIAEEYRADGTKLKLGIEAETNKLKIEIESEAQKKADITMGAADARAAQIYANVHNEDIEFYKFYKTLETYRSTLDPSTVFVLSTDNKYLQMLDDLQFSLYKDLDKNSK